MNSQYPHIKLSKRPLAALLINLFALAMLTYFIWSIFKSGNNTSLFVNSVIAIILLKLLVDNIRESNGVIILTDTSISRIRYKPVTVNWDDVVGLCAHANKYAFWIVGANSEILFNAKVYSETDSLIHDIHSKLGHLLNRELPSKSEAVRDEIITSILKKNPQLSDFQVSIKMKAIDKKLDFKLTGSAIATTRKKIVAEQKS